MEDRKPIVAVDLDGTILEIDLAKWEKCGMDYFGEPLPFAVEALEHIRSCGWHILIYTCRLNPIINPDVSTDEAKKRIGEVLDKYSIPYDEIYDGYGKPLADIYIDDRGFRFTTWVEVIEFMRRLSNEG